jgi:hypothetical protein
MSLQLHYNDVVTHSREVVSCHNNITVDERADTVGMNYKHRCPFIRCGFDIMVMIHHHAVMQCTLLLFLDG